jgi:YidC/Oxa1 family membrane protein insertase
MTYPMDNIRLVLFFALALVLLLIYQAWMQDYGPTHKPTAEPIQQSSGTEEAAKSDAVPQISSAEGATTATATTVTTPVVPGEAASDDLIQVETDLLRLEISKRGGTIVSAWLKKYAVTAKDPKTKFRLFKPAPPNMFIAQSGLLGGKKGQLPTHEAVFESSRQSYTLKEGQDGITVDLHWSGPTGIEVLKRYRLERGSYVIRFTQGVKNKSDAPLTARSYEQLQRTDLVDPNATRFVHTYTGGAYYSPEGKYKKESFDAMRKDKLQLAVTDGWIAMLQHYFMAAWIPPRGGAQTFFTNVLGDSRYIIGMYTEPVTLPSGVSHSFEDELFVGPKLQDRLAAIATGLELAVDYGWLTVLAEPIHWLLSKIHKVIGNWGWSIIILTILIKAAFYKLSETSYKSMAHMRQMTPRMQALKDRYGDDKQRLNQAMMELYKKEKINPLGGCLPIVVQIPVFIALYWVLLESVELRHAPFVLWIHNLSAPDPYFVLPLIMGVSMFIQQKLNPTPPDPIQAKVMMGLPFIFTVFFAFFPSGLVLYWVVNNILSIAQQWYITRNIERATAKARA